MRLGAFLSVTAAGAALTVAVAQASLPKALSQAAPGIWEMSGVPSAKAPVRQCVGDLLTLAKFEHRGQNCTPKIIRDGPTATTIEYSCSGGGFGRSEVGLITPRSLRIETQGISGGLPFHYVIQARRVGDCLGH